MIEVARPISNRTALAVEVAALLFVVLVANWAVAIWWPDDHESETSSASRPPHVYAIPHDPTALPPAPTSTVVLLIGNSHMYTLPGRTQGDRIQFDVGRTLLDELASEVALRSAGAHHVVRLSSPDFLPFEMLVRTSQLLSAGWRPNVVILGLHWTNVARGSQLRPQIRRVFKDQAALDDLLARLETIEPQDAALVRAAVENEAREIQKEMEGERTRSDVDEADHALTEELREYVPILRQSVALRADLYRVITSLQGRFAKEGAVKYNFAVIEEDRRFNAAVVRTLLALLHRSGARVVLYRAPVRQDLPPMTDPAREEETMGSLIEHARGLGMATVDARTVAADDEWGWHGQFPDRFHFVHAAHRRLALLLMAEVERLMEKKR